MQIQSKSQTQNFTSLNRPIKTEVFLSDIGRITMREANKKDIVDIAKGIRTIQMRSFKLGMHSAEKAEIKKIYNEIDKYQWLKDIKEYLMRILAKEDGKTSIMAVRNDDNKLIGFGTMESLDGKQNNVGVIEHLALDYDYRQDEEIPHYMLFKLLNSAKGQFDTVVVKDGGLAQGYRDLGFTYATDKDKDFYNRLYDSTGNYSRDWLTKKL